MFIFYLLGRLRRFFVYTLKHWQWHRTIHGNVLLRNQNESLSKILLHLQNVKSSKPLMVTGHYAWHHGDFSSHTPAILMALASLELTGSFWRWLWNTKALSAFSIWLNLKFHYSLIELSLTVSLKNWLEASDK